MHVPPTVPPALRSACLGVVAATSAALSASAQCQLAVDHLAAVSGVGEVACATEWDPDGSGPLPMHIVCGGELRQAGGAPIHHVAMWNPATDTWTALGNEFVANSTSPSGVVDLVVSGGELYAAGLLSNGVTGPTPGVARWDGSAWQPIANDVALSLAALPGGGIVAAGNILGVNGVARWDGTSWSNVGGAFIGAVRSVSVAANGDLLAGGEFRYHNGNPLSGVARWNGTSWSQIGAGFVAPSWSSVGVYGLEELPSGDLIATGAFQGTQGNGISRFDGQNWNPIGTIEGFVADVFELPNGELIAAGRNGTLISGATTFRGAARFDGTSWQQWPAEIDGSIAVIEPLASGAWFVGGAFSRIDGTAASSVAVPDANGWQTGNIGGPASSFTVIPGRSDDYYVIGEFASVGDTLARGVAHWDGSRWNPLGAGVATTSGGARTLTTLPNGDVVLGGNFSMPGGIDGIARWDGTSWSAFDNGLLPSTSSLLIVNMLMQTPDGRLIALGHFEVGPSQTYGAAEWNGTAWVPFAPSLPAQPRSAAFAGDGTLFVGGSFNVNGVRYHVLTFDGTSWVPSGSGGDSGFVALQPGDDGSVLAVGSNGTWLNGSMVQGAARWDGSNWVDMNYPSGFRTIATNASDSVLAIGSYTNGEVLRWDGSNWNPIGPVIDGNVRMAPFDDGTMMVANVTESGATILDSTILRIRSTCPATAASYGAGCTGSGGANVLRSVRAPWLGSDAEFVATGMAPQGIALAAFGFTPVATPLPNLLPQGQAGCALLVDPATLQLHTVQNGEARGAIAVPTQNNLVGVSFGVQVASIDLGGGAAIQAVTTTNALAWTIGVF